MARPQQAGLAHAAVFWLCIMGLGAILIAW